MIEYRLKQCCGECEELQVMSYVEELIDPEKQTTYLKTTISCPHEKICKFMEEVENA